MQDPSPLSPTSSPSPLLQAHPINQPLLQGKRRDQAASSDLRPQTHRREEGTRQFHRPRTTAACIQKGSESDSASLPPPRRGTSGAFAGRSFLRRRSLLATFGQRPPMGKSAGPLFESKRPRAPPEARACSRGLGSRPAAGLPRLRTRRGPPRRSSSQRCKRRFGAWGRLW